MRTAINAAIIKDYSILLVRKKQTWILPGGKPLPEESDIECLCREIKEELSGTELENIRYYKEFEGITPHRGDVLRAKVYFADIKGNLYRPSAEIEEHSWAKDPLSYSLSDITFKIINSLIEEGYLVK